MLDVGSKSPIGIAQRVFGRPSASLRMLSNIGPTFLQKGGESQGCRAADLGTPGNGKGGCLVSWGRYFAGGVRGGPDMCGVVALTDARVRRWWSWPAGPRGRTIGAED